MLFLVEFFNGPLPSNVWGPFLCNGPAVLGCGCCCLMAWHWYCFSSSLHKFPVGMKILCVKMKSFRPNSMPQFDGARSSLAARSKGWIFCKFCPFSVPSSSVQFSSVSANIRSAFG